jgi:hypothetical protein
VPSIHTGGFRMSLATSAETTTTAPPPSETMQHSSRCKGSAIEREASTSSIVIAPVCLIPIAARPRTASGLRTAWARVVTAISASCSGVVPYWYMCRCATSA